MSLIPRFCFYLCSFALVGAAPSQFGDDLNSPDHPIHIESAPIELTDQHLHPIRAAVIEASLQRDTETTDVGDNATFSSPEEEEAQKFMTEINDEELLRKKELITHEWDYTTNITDFSRQKYIEIQNKYGQHKKNRWIKIKEFLRKSGWKTWSSIGNESLKRQFKLFSVIGTAALPEQKYQKLTNITTRMGEIYSTAKLCDYFNSTKCDLSLEPDIVNKLKLSRDFDELSYIWKSWRDTAGKPSRELYSEFAALQNEGATLNGFASYADMAINPYEDEKFETEVARIYDQLKPLYQQLHAYVRRKLREVYGESRVPKRGPIAAHITGNMWAQSWINIYDLLMPYKDKPSLDVTNEMINQGYTSQTMFEKADDFFASIDLDRVPDSFWNLSILERPKDREIQCHASAWDFRDGKDFRVRQCSTVNMDYLSTTHHELGHIQYFLQYKHLPAVFRDGANPGFHEAIGDFIDLSVSTPKHLHKIGLLKTLQNDDETDINFLMWIALDRVAFLPFGYLIDKYRWDLFRGKITPENYTEAWWNYRYDLQGIAPPVERTEEDFDPAAKFHVSSHYNYISYFVARILQFQFYKAACLLAKEYDPADPSKPLHRCDFYQSKDAGQAIKNMLRLGASVHWRQALKTFTGEEEMNASALMEFFRPLENWLKKNNELHEEFIGWEGGYTIFTKKSATQAHIKEPLQKEHLLEAEGILKRKNASRTESDAQEFIDGINKEGALKQNEYALHSWNYQTNITHFNKQQLITAKNALGEYSKERWNRIQEWKEIWPSLKNETLKRQLKIYSVLGMAALPKHKLERFNAITSNLRESYSLGKICDYHNTSKCDLSLQPDIEEILKTSRDYDELEHVWKTWRNAVGKPTRCLYTEMVELLNEASQLNGFSSSAEMWIDDYEAESFESDMAKIYEQLHPLYQQLHAYTRRNLRKVYGESKIPKQGPIPAHVTGNMWAQSWSNIYDLLVPYPNKTSIDVTNKMVEQGYTPRIMFEKADEFFASLGLERVPESFWNKSVIEKPLDREMVCHASAWDFSDGKDFRIKQCTSVNMDHFSTVHHELGHVQYYMQYKDLPFIFQRGANPGFHEAVGDIMDLSVSTPKHLQKIGLLESYDEDDEADINFLLKTALDKVAFLPFGYLIDKYRWDIFRGRITPLNYTSAWWKYRYQFQGIDSPVERTELDFDPAAKSHVSSNTRYIRYFVATILQFQFHKAACILANEYNANDYKKPLHRCDIYQSKKAGEALKEMLKLGRSKHWSHPLKVLTGSDTIDASALREYFKPLEEWLKADNEKHNEIVGWEGFEKWLTRKETLNREDKNSELELSKIILDVEKSNYSVLNWTFEDETVRAESQFTESNAHIFIDKMNDVYEKLGNRLSIISWNYATNITDYNEKQLLAAENEFGEIDKKLWQTVQKWKDHWPSFESGSLKRQFKFYSIHGITALPKHKLNQYNIISNDLSQRYSTGKICDFRNPSKCDLSLNPDIENILRTSRDYEELTHVWKSWRDAVGKPARCLYSQMVELLNEGALLNDFPTIAEYYIANYESSTFEDDVERLYNQLRPLYQQLHAYTRRKLREVYGEARISKKGPIPAHVTGNMWAQSWVNIFDLLIPYANKTSIDVTSSMVEQNMTPELMFKIADEFFASLGLDKVPNSFWRKSVIKKPEGIEMVCHASAWDFADGEDFRIKQCTKITMEDFSTVHHELGHIQYYMQYKHLPHIFRRGANPGFHEAVGDVMDLSVSTPKHLVKIGLLYHYEEDDEADINFLLKTALEKVAFLPFGYMIDKFRWDVYRGRITPQNYTKAWWKFRFELQGLKPPLQRTEFDFDPAAKSHISTNTPYISYFVARILQFQFHKAACLLADEYDPMDPLKPLHRCDIYQSKKAGKALKEMLMLGRSQHWSQPLKALTGSEELDASALREYFRPLEEWLKADNEKHGEYIGWEEEESDLY